MEPSAHEYWGILNLCGSSRVGIECTHKAGSDGYPAECHFLLLSLRTRLSEAKSIPASVQADREIPFDRETYLCKV